jgi:hypothetical protein
MTIPGSVARNFIGRLHLEQMRIGGSSSRSELIRQPSLKAPHDTASPRALHLGRTTGLYRNPGRPQAGGIASRSREATSSGMFRRHCATPDEAISSFREKRRKDTLPIRASHDQQRSSVMWDQFFSLIYRLSCRTTLIEIGAHRLAR